MAERTFEFNDGTSAKFWKIAVNKSQTTTTWGRVGTTGQARTKELPSSQKARAEADKKIAQKLKKGYVEVQSKPASSNKPATSKKTEREKAAIPSAIELPAAWQKKSAARRGYPSADVPLAPKPNAARGKKELADCFGEQRELIAEAAINSDSLDPQLVELLTAPELPVFDPQNPLHIDAFAIVNKLFAPHQGSPYVLDYAIAEGGLLFGLKTELQATTRHLKSGTQYNPEPAEFVTAQGGHRVPNRYRLRRYLAQAPDKEYRAALKAARAFFETENWTATDRSLLFPTERWGVMKALTKPASRNSSTNYLFSSHFAHLRSPRDLDRLTQGKTGIPYLSGGSLADIIEVVGAEIVPYLVAWLDGRASPARPGGTQLSPRRDRPDAKATKLLLTALALFDSEEAIEAIASQGDTKQAITALGLATERHPLTAMPVLARHSEGRSSAAKKFARLLQKMIRDDPGAASSLTAEQRARLAKGQPQKPDTTALPIAPDKRVPTLLFEPPWHRRVRDPDTVIIENLEIPTRPVKNTRALDPTPEPYESTCDHDEPDWQAFATTINKQPRGRSFNEWYCASGFFPFCAPAPIVREVLAEWQPPSMIPQEWRVEAIEVLARRFGSAAIKGISALSSLTAPPGGGLGKLDPEHWERTLDAVTALNAAELALPISRALPDKLGHEVATAWLETHATAAALGLLPTMLGPIDSYRRNDRSIARHAIEHLLTSHKKAVLVAADSYGEHVRTAVDEMMAFDEFQQLPKQIPKIPEFALSTDATPLLKGGKHRLPVAALENLLVMIAISSADKPYAGVAPVLEQLDPASCAAYAEELFDTWELAGFPSKAGWVMTAQGFLGDDETVRRLVPLIRKWPGESAHKRAVAGLDALGIIGSELALINVHRIGRKVRFASLRKRSEELITMIAVERGLTELELGDRLVPDLDLDPGGTMAIDYGNRSFVISFDEMLTPVVRDQNGSVLKSLPRPGKNDDATLAPAAYKRFSLLKKESRSVAGDQLHRLEQAMLGQRRWSVEEFTALFVQHPLLIHLVRRLVWATYRDGTIIKTFRVAEDGTFASAKDKTIKLARTVEIGLPLPFELDPASLAAWGEVLSDYELLQPFEQVARQMFMVTPKKAVELLEQFNGIEVPLDRIIGLVGGAWKVSSPVGGAWSPGIERALPSGATASIEIRDSLHIDSLRTSPDPAHIDVIGVSRTPDQLEMSELIREIAALTDG